MPSYWIRAIFMLCLCVGCAIVVSENWSEGFNTNTRNTLNLLFIRLYASPFSSLQPTYLYMFRFLWPIYFDDLSFRSLLWMKHLLSLIDFFKKDWKNIILYSEAIHLELLTILYPIIAILLFFPNISCVNHESSYFSIL